MAGMQWGRLQLDVSCNLRRGAWYRVLRIEGFQALVDVNATPRPVISALLEISNKPPRHWTVVPRPRDAARLLADVGEPYAVCPSCRNRQWLPGKPRRMSCARCRGEFAVAWDEQYLRSI